MGIRLASFADCTAFLKGGDGIAGDSEKNGLLNIILDGVSSAIETEIIGTSYSLLQSTSDGTSSPLEFFGTENYGKNKRNIIRFPRFPVISVASVVDCNRLVDPSNYYVDPLNAILYLRNLSFSNAPRAVQVVYTAGFPEQGTDDQRKLIVPINLRNACLAQMAFEWSRATPGGVPFGASSISRPDGSVVIQGGGLLTEVQRVIQIYKKAGY
jgi:hypothetical protein